MPFSRLPDPSLQPYTGLREFRWYSRDSKVQMQPSEVKYIASLTALETLELGRFFNWSSLKPLQTLPLHTLRLLHCSHMELDLLVPNALQSLRELHITDTEPRLLGNLFVKYWVYDPSLQHRIEKAADTLLQLPKLCRLIGTSEVNRQVLKRLPKNCGFSYQERP